MTNESAFRLLRDALREGRQLRIEFFPDWDGDLRELDMGIRAHFSNAGRHYEALRKLIKSLTVGEILVLRDRLLLYTLMFRGDTDTHSFYSVGPFQALPLEESSFAPVAAANSLTDTEALELRALLLPVPCNIPPVEALAAAKSILRTFHGIEEPTLRSLTLELGAPDTPSIALEDDRELRVRRVVQIYEHQDRLSAAIAAGDLETALEEGRWFLHTKVPSCIPDPSRSEASLLTAANTMFRLALQGVGIHPVFLDEISQKFVWKLDNALTSEQLNSVYLEMITEYCGLARSHAVQGYSRAMQKIMNHIALHLGSDLTMETISRSVNFSASYIARLFKDELDTTAMAYITRRRIETAKKLLLETEMSVREIAAYVGIPDWSYFTKVFRKSVGETPTDFRKEVHAQRS